MPATPDIYQSPNVIQRYADGGFGDYAANASDLRGLRNAMQYFFPYLNKNVPRHRTILDAGCATGNLGRSLARCRPDLHYIGADPSEPMLAAAQKLAAPGARFTAARIPGLPFKNDSIPVVVCAGTLWYCDDLFEALADLYRVTSRIMLAEIMFLPDVDTGCVTTHVVEGIERKVTIPGHLELSILMRKLFDIRPFKDLRQNNRFTHIEMFAEKSGLPELKGRRVKAFCVIFEKRISASLIKIFNQPEPKKHEQSEAEPPASDSPE